MRVSLRAGRVESSPAGSLAQAGIERTRDAEP
jgi:hypothetical protein